MNSRPQNYHQSRCVPSNGCVYCGKLWGNFNPIYRMRIFDWITKQPQGWICSDGCQEFEIDDDDSIEIS